jgi:hypothetical protein
MKLNSKSLVANHSPLHGILFLAGIVSLNGNDEFCLQPFFLAIKRRRRSENDSMLM